MSLYAHVHMLTPATDHLMYSCAAATPTSAGAMAAAGLPSSSRAVAMPGPGIMVNATLEAAPQLVGQAALDLNLPTGGVTTAAALARAAAAGFQPRAASPTAGLQRNLTGGDNATSVVASAGAVEVAVSSAGTDRLNQGWVLNRGWCLRSRNGRFWACNHEDGNFVLWDCTTQCNV